MKFQGTAPAFAMAPYRVSRLLCPQCHDLIIAATKSQHVNTNEVRHWWACESCGHEFGTTVQIASLRQGTSGADSTMARRSQRDANIRGANIRGANTQ
jgi:RNase P subunit RPR2